MRRSYIAGNWKMNKTVDESVALAKELAGCLGSFDAADVGVAPTALALAPVAGALAGSAIRLGAQNCHWEASGAFTGELAPAMLLAAGCRFVIVGHSERRQYFGETNETANRKVRAALEAGLEVILCVGETLAEREKGVTERIVRSHVTGALEGLDADAMARVTIAYEPVWAIGTGRTATPDQAQAVHAFVRGLLLEGFSAAVADATRIQYGGSVKPENAAVLLSQPDIDGALVGGASLKADAFEAIVRAAEGSGS